MPVVLPPVLVVYTDLGTHRDLLLGNDPHRAGHCKLVVPDGRPVLKACVCHSGKVAARQMPMTEAPHREPGSTPRVLTWFARMVCIDCRGARHHERAVLTVAIDDSIRPRDPKHVCTARLQVQRKPRPPSLQRRSQQGAFICESLHSGRIRSREQERSFARTWIFNSPRALSFP